MQGRGWDGVGRAGLDRAGKGKAGLGWSGLGKFGQGRAAIQATNHSTKLAITGQDKQSQDKARMGKAE